MEHSSGVMMGPDGTLLLRHIKIVQQSRELVSAIRSHTTLDNSEDAENALESFLGGAPPYSRLEKRDLRQSEAEVTLLVLKDVEEPSVLPEQEPNAAELLLSTVREIVFHSMQLPLMTLVYSQSFHQAWEVRDLCVSIAVSLVAPNNCFSLFRVADECTLPQLQSVCLATGLTEFSQAVEIDKAGFCSLDLAQLLRFLENDRMQVVNELEVFDAVTKWIESSLETRLSLLCHLLESGVRLELMDRGLLAEVDAHSLVVQDKEASGKVARAYMQCCYGNFISGQAREPRLRCKLPLPQVASMDNLSVASCGGQSREDVLSTCRKARPAALHTIGEDSVFSDAAVGANSGSGLAMSCVRPEGGIKRKLDMRSPESSITPALRNNKGAAASQAPHSDTKEEAAPFNRLPSKRRLF